MREKRHRLTFQCSQENIRKRNRWKQMSFQNFRSPDVSWALVTLPGLYWQSQLPPYWIAIVASNGRLSLLYVN